MTTKQTHQEDSRSSEEVDAEMLQEMEVQHLKKKILVRKGTRRHWKIGQVKKAMGYMYSELMQDIMDEAYPPLSISSLIQMGIPQTEEGEVSHEVVVRDEMKEIETDTGKVNVPVKLEAREKAPQGMQNLYTDDEDVERSDQDMLSISSMDAREDFKYYSVQEILDSIADGHKICHKGYQRLSIKFLELPLQWP